MRRDHFASLKELRIPLARPDSGVLFCCTELLHFEILDWTHRGLSRKAMVFVLIKYSLNIDFLAGFLSLDRLEDFSSAARD